MWFSTFKMKTFCNTYFPNQVSYQANVWLWNIFVNHTNINVTYIIDTRMVKQWQCYTDKKSIQGMPLFVLQIINRLLQTCLPYSMFLKIKIATIHLITDITTQGCKTITYVTPTLFFINGNKENPKAKKYLHINSGNILKHLWLKCS